MMLILGDSMAEQAAAPCVHLSTLGLSLRSEMGLKAETSLSSEQVNRLCDGRKSEQDSIWVWRRIEGPEPRRLKPRVSCCATKKKVQERAPGMDCHMPLPRLLQAVSRADVPPLK